MTSAWTLLVAVALGLEVPAPAKPEPGDIDRVLERVAERYRGAAAIEGRFVQAYTNRVLGRTIEEQGRLVLVPPHKMRWEYTEPDAKLFVTGGRWAWFYVPEDAVAYRLRLDEERTRLLPSRFITGDTSLGEEFAIEEIEGPEDARVLRLVPRQTSEEFEHLELELERETLAIRALSVVDTLGNKTVYRFHELERKGPVPDELFEFTPPTGVEIVGES